MSTCPFRVIIKLVHRYHSIVNTALVGMTILYALLALLVAMLVTTITSLHDLTIYVFTSHVY